MHNKYTDDQLAAMGRIYYSKKVNGAQKYKYDFIRSELLKELRELNPSALDSGTALYIQHAISACKLNAQFEDRRLSEQARANMQSAHNQLLNYDPQKKEREE